MYNLCGLLYGQISVKPASLSTGDSTPPATASPSFQTRHGTRTRQGAPIIRSGRARLELRIVCAGFLMAWRVVCQQTLHPVFCGAVPYLLSFLAATLYQPALKQVTLLSRNREQNAGADTTADHTDWVGNVTTPASVCEVPPVQAQNPCLPGTHNGFNSHPSALLTRATSQGGRTMAGKTFRAVPLQHPSASVPATHHKRLSHRGGKKEVATPQAPANVLLLRQTPYWLVASLPTIHSEQKYFL